MEVMWKWRGMIFLAALAGLLVGCAGGEQAAAPAEDQQVAAGPPVLALPEVSAVELNGRPLRVVATTSIIGDVVAQVGGEAIELTTLMTPGQDPHSYQPGAAQLTAVSDADVLFLNGWDLEESLVSTLQTIGALKLFVPISASIKPLPFGEGDEHGGADPHVWLDVANVQQWTRNVQQVLSELDPAHAAEYAANAAAYLAQLETLQNEVKEEVATIPPEKRLLVTNHESLNYFALAYGFETVGTVIPAASTLAEPSAGELAALVEVMRERGVCTIFTETTVSDTLAQTVAAELEGCVAVEVHPLYTGSLGVAGGGADSYVGMMRNNAAKVAEGLR